MKIKNAFTLIELLAVIIILAIVALIATPIILNVIEDSKNSANLSQAEILYSGAQTLYASGILNDSLSEKFNGTDELYSLLETTNEKPEYGTLKIDSSGKIMFATYIDGKCYSSVEGESILKVEEIENPLDCAPKDVPIEKPYLFNDIINADNIVQTNNYLGTTDYRYNNTQVNNYIQFNDESWRIIGLINDNIKIIKTTYVSSQAYSSNNNNNWANSSLQLYLNTNYYNSLTESAKNMIITTTFNLGGVTKTNTTYDNIYNMENSTNVYPGNPTTINSKIALMYASDYLYSMNLSCKTSPDVFYQDENCRKNGTWLYNNGEHEWFLGPGESSSNIATYVSYSGRVLVGDYSNYVNDSFTFRPVTFLNKEVEVISGTGTKVDPYILKYD